MRDSPYVWATRRAEKLVAEWGISSLPVDLREIAREHGIPVRAMPPEMQGVSGMLLRAGESYGIAYATFIDNEGFQRFSIAHELGHYFLDGHPEKVLAGTDAHQSQAGFGSGDRFELEADHFAAGLLMPDPLFARAMDKAGKGFRAIERLKEVCGTSITATAIRYAERAEEPVAVVVSTGQVIDYWFGSDAFKRIPDITWLKKGDPVPSGTPTAAFNRDPGKVARSARVEGSSGVLDWFGDGPDRELSEDVVGLGGYGKTLTVLFAEDWPDEDEEEEDDASEWNPRFHKSRRR